MRERLSSALEKAKTRNFTAEQMEEGRIAIAAANGNLSNPQITIETMKATRTIMKAAETNTPDENKAA